MEHKTVAIAIPYYKNELSSAERASLKQCLEVLGAFDIWLVSPKSLDVNPDVPISMHVLRFEDEYFKGIRGYNKLMLSEEFYQRFTAYDYVLIYQLDAFVFRDELQFWADKGYDYIGAPWIHRLYSTSDFGSFILLLKKILYTIAGNKKKVRKYIHYNNVGNGGLSLRRVERMVQVTHKYKDKIANLLSDEKDFYPEDLLLTVELRGNESLKKPSFREALGFSFDVRPSLAYELNDRHLPFGCHAFSKSKENKFWHAFINT